MPRPRRPNLSQQSRNARRLRNVVNNSTEEEREIGRQERRVGMARLRASQSQEQREEARETARLAMRNRRANLNPLANNTQYVPRIPRVGPPPPNEISGYATATRLSLPRDGSHIGKAGRANRARATYKGKRTVGPRRKTVGTISAQEARYLGPPATRVQSNNDSQLG
ncbi:hypothetical protein J6590_070924 [Homalodisca vitripennis]|nr:hypothetical protein J6590_070924 [Homalodisca vitripennis]